jgi:hypothetical protein
MTITMQGRVAAFGIENREKRAKARNHFAGLDTYARDQIAVLGTAFTTYEDEGPVFCAELYRVAREWRNATMTVRS